MTLRCVGDVSELVGNPGGQGKSSVAADMGDQFKPPGQG